MYMYIYRLDAESEISSHSVNLPTKFRVVDSDLK